MEDVGAVIGVMHGEVGQGNVQSGTRRAGKNANSKEMITKAEGQQAGGINTRLIASGFR